MEDDKEQESQEEEKTQELVDRENQPENPGYVSVKNNEVNSMSEEEHPDPDNSPDNPGYTVAKDHNEGDNSDTSEE